MDRKEAIEIIIKNYPHVSNSGSQFESALRELIPELKESEDERIRKELTAFVKFALKDGETISLCSKTTKEDVIAYLEKQKDQSITENDLDAEIHRFLDDCIVVHEAKLYGNISERVIPVDGYEVIARHFAKWGERHKEQKHADQCDKGRRGRLGGIPEHIRKKAENFLSKTEPPYDADDICSAYETGAMESIKQEWSEEDEKYLNIAINIVSSDFGEDSPTVSWLKSLRPQPHWKPSKEQIDALWKLMQSAVHLSNWNKLEKPIEAIYRGLKSL